MGSDQQLESYWIASTPSPRFKPLEGKRTFEVCIIGAGITGMTAALLLARQGKSVAVLERWEVGAGESGYTTAHLTELVDGRYDKLRSKFGKSEARMVRQASRAAMDRIAGFVREEQIACQLEELPLFLYSEDERGVAGLEKEAEAAGEAGMEVTLSASAPLPFPVKRAARFERQAQFHPREYLRGLARALTQLGGEIFEHSRVTAIHDGTPCRVETELGEVTATSVLDLAHVPLGNKVVPYTRQAAYRSYAIGVTVSEAPARALFQDCDDPYHYTRTVAFPGGTLLIIGGEDHKTGSERDTATHHERLESYARERWSVEEVLYRWSGQINEPADGLPFIGKSPHSEGLFMATGYSGNGMTWGTFAGMLLCDLLTGQPNPYAELLSPARIKPLAQAAAFLQENADSARHFVADRFKRAEVSSPAEIPPGQGAICKLKGDKVAIYRDTSGAIHALSPVCPHLGCHVAWNGAERSWDCPCHGSRFSPEGQVTNGPALQDLAKKKLE